MAIYVNFDRPDTIKEFIIKFYTNEEKIFVSTYDNVIINGHKTYVDKKCTEIQCDDRRRRSLTDLIELIQTYFPEATEKDIIHEFLISEYFLNIKEEYYPYLSFCTTIMRSTFFFYRSEQTKYGFFIKENPYYDYYIQIRNLLALLDIHSDEEINEYKEKHKLTKIEV